MKEILDKLIPNPLALVLVVISAATLTSGGFYIQGLRKGEVKSVTIEITPTPSPTPSPTTTPSPTPTSKPTEKPFKKVVKASVVTLPTPTATSTPQSTPTPTSNPTASPSTQASSGPRVECEVSYKDNKNSGPAPLNIEFVYAASFYNSAGMDIYVKEIQWDFDGNNVWDTPYDTSSQHVSHTYNQTGEYTVRMQLKANVSGIESGVCTGKVSVTETSTPPAPTPSPSSSPAPSPTPSSSP